MKLQNKAIIVIATAASIYAGSVTADDFNTVITVQNDGDASYQSARIDGYNVSIQDYIDEAVRAQSANINNNSVTEVGSVENVYNAL